MQGDTAKVSQMPQDRSGQVATTQSPIPVSRPSTGQAMPTTFVA